MIPELPVPDVGAALDYDRVVLGFSVEGRHEDETRNGRIGCNGSGGLRTLEGPGRTPH